MVRMFSSAHAYFMNSTVGEKQKDKSKANLSCSIRDRHAWELVQYMDHTIPQSMDMKMQTPLYLSCTSP